MKPKSSNNPPIKQSFQPKSSKLGGLAIQSASEHISSKDWFNDTQDTLLDPSAGLFPAWNLYFSDPYSDDHEFIPIIKCLIPILDKIFYFKFNNTPDEFNKLLKELDIFRLDWTKIRDQVSEDSRLLMMTNPSAFINCIGIASCQSLLGFQSRSANCNIPMSKKTIRLFNYDKITPLKDIKANMMGKFICIRATVVRVSSVMPIVRQMTFICISCHSKMQQVFPDGKFKSPNRCSTFGCKGRVFAPDRGTANSTVTVDWQKVRVQEKLSDDQLDSGRIPRTMDCELSDDLVDSIVPGDVVCISGIIKVLSTEEGKTGKSGSQMYQLYMDVNSLIKAGSSSLDDINSDTFSKDTMDFSEKDLHGIREVFEYGGDKFKLLVQSLCPQIFGHEMVKAGLLLVLFGGRKRDDDSKQVHTRSNPHILIVGDPGLGKSQLLSATVHTAPRGVYICGNTATSSGLTVTMRKDTDTGEMALEAGALVLGDQGVCCIDEFDKMTEHHSLLEAMEQQSISIAKAGIVCSLPARTSVIAAANPIGGHYNKSKTVAENIKMNGALLSRFDLVFILLDNADERKDQFLSDHIMKLHSGGVSKLDDMFSNTNASIDNDDEEKVLSERLKSDSIQKSNLIHTSLLKKYIAYARQYAQPRLTSEASAVLKNFYLTLRRDYRSHDSTPITTRQLESLIRLSEARARLELRNEVLESDASDVVEILKYSLWETYEDGKGNVDFTRSQHGSGSSKRGEIKRYISELQRIAEECSNSRFNHDNLYQIAKSIKLKYENFGDLLDSLNNQGYLLKKGNRNYQLMTI